MRKKLPVNLSMKLIFVTAVFVLYCVIAGHSQVLLKKVLFLGNSYTYANNLPPVIVLNKDGKLRMIRFAEINIPYSCLNLRDTS
jgi:hypothetical protein